MNARLRLIAVEDSEADAELGLIELRRSGFDVELRRADTRELLEQALAEGVWDLVLCDYGLPSFSSTEALAMVKAYDPELPFVVLSGTIGEEAAVDALKSGARDVVIKTNLSRLGTVAERELREAAARRRHRQAESELQDSEARKRAILDAALDAVLAVDEDGIIVEVNPAAVAMFAAPAAELCGRAITELLPIGDGLADGLELADGRLAGLRVERTAARTDGEPFPGEVSVAQIYLAGRPFFTVTVRDLTERRRVEAENRALQDQLLQAQKMEAMGRLAAGITHDFNNIIAIVSGYSSLALKQVGDDGRLGSWLQAISEAGERAQGLTRQLLAFTRQQVLEPTELDLSRHVTEMRSMLEMLARTNVKLSLQLPEDLRPVRADPQQLGQVLLNLVVNAIDAMPDGGLVTVQTGNAHVTESLLVRGYGLDVPAGRYAVLSVSDTGMGMDDTVKAHIFDPFFTTKGVGEGTGLGLSTVFGIVSQSGGGISVESEPGAGATFRIYLPAT